MSDSSRPLVLAESCQVGVVSSRGWGRDAGAQRDPVTPQSRVRKYDRTGTQGRGPPAAPCPLQSRDSSCVTPGNAHPKLLLLRGLARSWLPQRSNPRPCVPEVTKAPSPLRFCSSGALRQFSVKSSGLARGDPAAAPPPILPTPPGPFPEGAAALPLPHPSPFSPTSAPAPVQNHCSKYSGIYIYFQLMLGSSH